MSESGGTPAGRRVLVTGASGYIGHALCRRLVELGADVRGASRRRPTALADVDWYEVDLGSELATDELVGAAAPDVIYHLAGSVTGVRDAEQVVPVFTSTLASTVHLLAAAHRHGSGRVVLASSMEEPAADGGVPIPSSPYAAAKWASGGYGRMFASLFELDVVELRVFMTYGPGHQPLGKLIPAVVLSLLRGQVPALGSGQRRIDWIYIDDVVAALVLAATAKVPVGVRPDIGSGQARSIRDFVTRLAHHVDPGACVDFGAQADRPVEREVVADVTTARALLGWEPHTDLEVGLARVVAWYRERYEAGDFDLA